MTISDAIKIIADCQGSSMQCWDMAIDTADTQAAKEAWRADAEACDAHYDAALECLEGRPDGWLEDARRELENASQLEKDGGDNQHAQRALAALDALTDRGDG